MTPWAKAEQFSLYLRSGKKYFLLHIGGVECVLVEAEEKNFNLSAFRKQMTKLPGQPKHVVLSFKYLESRQKKALIEAQIPFIVPGSQVYLPFLGVVLQERMKSVKAAPEKCSPTAQMVLLYLMYGLDVPPFRKVELAKRLEISAMNVTRAVRELEALGMVAVKTAGRSDYVSVINSGKSLYETALPYMIDPVQKRIFVQKKEMFAELPMAGEYALATHSMLNRSQIECRAISRKRYKELDGVEEIDPAWSNSLDYLQLELWKYDPQPLAFYCTVDVISLALSLRGNKDERVEQAVEEMMEGYKW